MSIKLDDVVMGVVGLAGLGIAAALAFNATNTWAAMRAADDQPAAAKEALAAQAKELSEARWVDQTSGIVSLPIEQAMADVQKELADGSYKPFLQTEEMKAAAMRKLLAGVTVEKLDALKADKAAVEEGKQLFAATACVACHKADGTGVVGPNLTDPYWLHGSKPTDIYLTIMNGAPNGMPAHKDSLGQKKVMKVVAYIEKTFVGKNLPGKAPQGVDADGNPPPG